MHTMLKENIKGMAIWIMNTMYFLITFMYAVGGASMLDAYKPL